MQDGPTYSIQPRNLLPSFPHLWRNLVCFVPNGASPSGACSRFRLHRPPAELVASVPFSKPIQNLSTTAAPLLSLSSTSHSPARHLEFTLRYVTLCRQGGDGQRQGLIKPTLHRHSWIYSIEFETNHRLPSGVRTRSMRNDGVESRRESMVTVVPSGWTVVAGLTRRVCWQCDPF